MTTPTHNNLYCDTLETSGNASMGANLNVVGNQTIAGNQTVAGTTSYASTAMISSSLLTSGSVSISTSGFFTVAASGSSGMGYFTGSLPAASSYPGGEVMIIDTYAQYPYMLSGSFAAMSGSGGGNFASTTGTHLKCSAGTSVGLWSDSTHWLVCACSGTLALST